MKLQVTLFDKNKVYKPLSTVLEVPNMDYVTDNKKALINKAYQQIASRKYMLSTQLYNDGYTIVKMREYNKEKIKTENMVKYVWEKRQAKKTGDN